MTRPDTRFHGFALAGAVTALLAVILLQLLLLARANSATWDEADHIYSAYMQTKHGDFGLNPEHPPLIKFLGALPLLHMRLNATMGSALDASGRSQEALAYDQKALALAQTTEPQFQQSLIEILDHRLKSKGASDKVSR